MTEISVNSMISHQVTRNQRNQLQQKQSLGMIHCLANFSIYAFKGEYETCQCSKFLIDSIEKK